MIPRNVHAIVLGVLLAALPQSVFGEPLAAGQPTSLDSKESKETEQIVERIHQLAEEARHGAPQFSMIGEAHGAGSVWAVNGETFTVDDSTAIIGKLDEGKLIEVRGIFGAGQSLRARQIVVHEHDSSAQGASAGRLSPSDARKLR